MKRFLGCQYPLVKSVRGILAQKMDVEQIKADLLQLLLTNPGERVMLPEFGTPLRKLIFEPNDGILQLEARNAISNAISRWEPRIEIEGISVTSDNHVLLIQIRFFDPVDITEIQELKLEVPIGEA